jgi:hypothetical protein
MRKSLIVSIVCASTLALTACKPPKAPDAAANATDEIVAPSENSGEADGNAMDGAMTNAAETNMAATPNAMGNAEGGEPEGAGSNGGPVIKKP